MNVNQQLLAVLSPFGLPVRPGADTAHRERCITFNYDLLPVHFVDNRPVWWQALIQIHLFLPLHENSAALRIRLARALAQAGFGWPEIVDAGDGDTQHYVFETEWITDMEEST